MATLSDVNVGSAVSWSINKDPDPPSTIHGIVTSINSEEEILTVKVWAILEDGSHEETDRSVEVEVGKVRIIQDFRSEGKQLSARVEKVLRAMLKNITEKILNTELLCVCLEQYLEGV